MKLTKMHGLGNDFILFSDSQGANKDYTDLAIRLCDRRTGIGADGLVIVVPSNTCDVRMPWSSIDIWIFSNSQRVPWRAV